MIRLLLIFGMVLILCLPANTEVIRIEGESYVASHDEGGVAIYITACSGASGGLAIEGFDYPGDWIEFAIDVSEAGSYADTLRSGGLTAQASDHQTTVVAAGPSGEDLNSPFHTLGEGIG